METNLRYALPRSDASHLNHVENSAHSGLLAWFSCLLSLLMLCLTIQIGAVATALFIIPWAVLATRNSTIAFFKVIENFPLFVIPVFALISIAWSQDPDFSLRASFQFILTTVIAIWAGSLIHPRAFVSTLTCALLIVNIVGLVLDGGASFRGEGPLIGVFGAKNQLAFHALIQLIAALTVVFDRGQAFIMRLVALFALSLAPVCLVQAQSVGALVFGVPAIVTCLAVPRMRSFSLAARVTVVATTLFIAVVAVIVVRGLVDDTGAVLDALGKDSTLTGREYVWQRARVFIEQAPLLGVGYQAFWRVGNPAAEDLWTASHEESGAGFNFHNTYLHTTVDLGYIGLALLIITLVWMAIRLIRAIILSPDYSVGFAAALFVYLFTTSFIEVAILYQFSLSSLLFDIVWMYSHVRPRVTLSKPVDSCEARGHAAMKKAPQ